jgi:hypothetical protein
MSQSSRTTIPRKDEGSLALYHRQGMVSLTEVLATRCLPPRPYSCSIISWTMTSSVQMYGSSLLIILYLSRQIQLHFTNDCMRFLIGGSIPASMKGAFLLLFFPVSFTEQTFLYSDLPADFLSTPLGAWLGPTIDAMFTLQQPNHWHQPPPPPSYNPSPLAPQPQCRRSTRATAHPHPRRAPSATTRPQPQPRPPTHRRTQHHSAACWAYTAPSWRCSRPRRAG